MKVKSLIGLIVCILVTAALVFTAVCGFTITMPISGETYYFPSALDNEYGITKGLDLVGGSIIAFDASVDNPTVSEMESIQEVMRSRLDSMGYYDAEVALEGNKTVRISIPNISNPEEAVQILGATAKLSFTDADGNEVLGSNGVKSATYVYGPTTENGANEHYVQLSLTSEGQEKFKNATAMAVTKKTEKKNYISIKLDDEVISSPYVDQTIDSATCVITGTFTEKQAKALANQIQSGNLPFSLVESELRSVGPTLGEKALATSLVAALIGILIVMLFMLVFYRGLGFIADLALVGYIALVALVCAGYFLPEEWSTMTLTLPGIAGIILSIGMAVDANVIIFERIKEEIRIGKTPKTAVRAGYKRALTAVLDGNITTIIAAVVLYMFGTASIKGFALTLAIGVVISMLTAVFVSRLYLNIFVNLGVKDPKWFGVSTKANEEVSE